MAQWGQQGYQYPMQTGYNPQFQQGFQPGGGIAPQPTGFPAQRPQGFQQPQQTGFPGVSSFQQPQQTGFPQQQALLPQQTGFPGAGSGFQQRAPPPPPPVPPIPSQFQQQNAGRFMAASPLTAQPTGYPGAGGMRPLMPQMTGYVDPRLQMMSSTFLPANPSMPYNQAGAPQLPSAQLQGGMSLQQSFQQHNQAQRGNTTPKVPWALSKAEKKNYDQIFRAWDLQSTGFINGQTALEVFGQSGLDKNDLAKIWALADVDNRGKLNLAEFHVAMGLIYRCLNGNEIPDELPAELVPPSHRDLDTSVNLLKDILKNDTRARSPSGLDAPVSKLKERSFNSTSAPGAGGRQDATVYKYKDESPPGGFYQPRSRHVDRSTVRTAAESENPTADLDDMKRQLENTAKMLDRSADENASRTAEDEALEREMEDLRYRVNRVKDDLDYVSRGPRSVAKDEERRRLERELLKLMHERIPEVERKIKDREERRAREKREWARERDRRNERFGRYDDRDDRHSSRFDDDRDRYRRSSYDRDERDRDYDRDRPYSRNRDKDYDHDRDRERDRDRDRDYDRPRSPYAARSPPPAPPSAPPPSAISNPPPPVPTPSKSPAPNVRNMSAEERKAFIQAEAKRRMQERMAALGVSNTPSPSPKLDNTVEDRLARERQEAEERARQAEKEAEERERVRRERLQSEKALKDGAASPAPPTPTTATSAPLAPPTPSTQVPTPKPTPPPPKPRAPAPPPPRKVPAPRAPATRPAAPPAPAPVVAAPRQDPEEDPEEQEIRKRQEALRKQRERLERLRQLEQEEEEARRAEEEYQAKRRAFQAKTASPVPTPPAAITPAPPAPIAPPAPEIASPPTAPAPPPPPPPPVASPPTDKSATNPFSRMLKESPGAASSPSTPATNGSTNPFFKNQVSSPSAPPASTPPTFFTPPIPPAPAVPPSSKSPAPPAVKTTYHTAPGESEGEWDEIEEKDDDDSSDDELDSSRDTRNKLAQALFGGILPPSRPQSAAAASSKPPPPVEASSTPSAPLPPPSAPPTMDNAPVPPPPPMAPAAPLPPAVAAPAPTGDRSALLGAIQMGARLRKAQTNDRSAAPVSGKVVGDTAPPPHINPARAPSPPAPSESIPATLEMPTLSSQRSSNRDSVDWYAGLAADSGAVQPAQLEHLPSMQEEDEPDTPVPEIKVDTAENDPMSDVDKLTEYHVRSLYPYEGQRAEDLSFAENLMLIAHPSKSGGEWWYGTLVRDGKSGFFPKTYVAQIEQVKARALYSYTGSSTDELPFSEGDELSIVDRSEADWWKAEQGGVIFIVPAGYLEVMEEIVESDEESASGSDYDSFSESDTGEDEEMNEEVRAVEREARELERQRVLEAAGFIIKSDVKPPPRPVRTRSRRKRRPPPAVPRPRSTSSLPLSPEKDLPEPPEPEDADHSLRLDDAFERYEAFRQANPNVNRLSIASMDSNTSMQTPTTPITRSASTEPEPRVPLLFFSIFGRKTPANDGEARTMPVISAPILTKDAGTPTMEGDSGFGSSWGSLVDRSALEEIPVRERRRQEAIFELITTEAAYVRDLQLIVELFYTHLLEILDERAVKVIFANVEEILLTNTTLLSSLEERQKECRLYIDTIGDILRANMPEMDKYVVYCVNQAYAIRVLQSLRESNLELSARLQRLRDDPAARNLDLSSYLLVPMQRITRYPLLIKQILHYTEMSDDRRQIENALAIAERILENINETIREQEGRERLRVISKDLWLGHGRLDLTAPTRYGKTRRLLKEGTLMKAKSGRRLRAFLCSDILVLTEDTAKRLYRTPIPLGEVRVREMPGHRDDLAFQLVTAYPRGGDTIALRANSARDCQLWMQAIENASKMCRETERNVASR
ncbi:hypothetical protein IEO21_08793 [Rhodonia placenta]|uniref:Actin cytoskeleton-regulatory complex protein PAN1 n=1 Tax=Rhodonia placenta TaxID=104341 RepID=A0A8H7NVG8_9APHY|nr:hypothetical protein IEO21_08793 [Postia placenta]